MPTTPTTAAANVPRLKVLCVGQERAAGPDPGGALRSLDDPLGLRARQRTRGRLCDVLHPLRPVGVSVVALLHAHQHQQERDQCPSTRKPEEFFRA